MITRPTKFEQHHRRAGGTHAVGVSFWDVDFTVCYYFASTRDMHKGNVPAQHVHSHLINISSINEKVDLHTKKWATSDITIKLLNPRFSPAGNGVRDRVSEGPDPYLGIFSMTDWAMVQIYFLSGESGNFLDHGIVRFEGRIIGTPVVTEKIITVRAQVIEKEKHRMLPTTIVGDIYSDAPRENFDKRIPICYGDFTENYWNELNGDGDLFSGNGLIKSLRIDSETESKYVISDHILYSATGDVFISVKTLLPARIDTPTITLDDSGRGTFVWNFVGSGSYRTGTNPYRKYARQIFILNDTVPAVWTEAGLIALNPANAHDFNLTTDVTIRDTYYDDSEFGFWGLAAFGINEEDLLRESITTLSFSRTSWINLGFYDWRKDPERETAGYLYASFYYSSAGGNLNLDAVYQVTSIVPSGFYNRSGWSAIHCGRCSDVDFENIEESDEGITDLVIVIGIRRESYYDADGLDNDDLGYIKELRVEIQTQIDELPLEAWIEGCGREYESWITDGGRSIDSRSPGGLIENQAHIIESILRDELGVTTGDIDTASFDFAYDSATAEANRQARLNIHKETSSAKVIREIAEQSTFAFTWTAAGKAKLIPLYSSYWSGKSVDSTIPWSHIKAGSLKISKTKIYCNEVEVQSRWHGETGLYRDTDTVSDSGSQTDYGTWRRSAKWPNLAGDTRSHVAARYVNSTDGLWSRKHLLVEFETLGFTNAHLELGDCVQLDATTVDPHLKAYAESWSGPKLCVIELQQTMTGTKIKAIELF